MRSIFRLNILLQELVASNKFDTGDFRGNRKHETGCIAEYFFYCRAIL